MRGECSTSYFAKDLDSSMPTLVRSSQLMRREEMRAFFDASPTAKLLRSDNAPWVVDFLQRVFKSPEAISLGLNELRIRLVTYQDEVHELEPDVLKGPAERYITQWIEAGWLKRFVHASSSEPQFQLAAHAEEAILLVDSSLARRRNMVGTEGRLRLVIDSLEDIVRGSSADPERRLTYLRSQRSEIDQEIAAIESGKSVQVYRESQIRERFQTAMGLLRELQADFRAVEERFQEIAREVQQMQSSGNDSRGTILGFALDAEDTLKQRDEGQSFFAFVRFLLSPVQQRALRRNIEEIERLEALADQSESLTRLSAMVPSLLAEADKVMRTTARLSSTLRRLLDARAASHRLRLAKVLYEIRQAALQLRNDPPTSLETTVEAQTDIRSPLARPFWEPEATFENHAIEEQVVDIEQAAQMTAAFARMHRLDFRQLRSHIREATLTGDCTLGRLLGEYPATGGIVDVLGYIQIAHDDHHSFDNGRDETVTVKMTHGDQQFLRVRVPHIQFQPRAAHREVGRKPR